MKTALFDIFSGIAGDMTIAALIDAGADLNYLKSELNKLGISGFEIARMVKTIFPFCSYNFLLININMQKGSDKIYMASKNFNKAIYFRGYNKNTNGDLI